MSNPTSLPPAGWYPDPQGGDGQRWWNGAAWSNETRPATPVVPATPAAPAAPAAPADYSSAQQGYPDAQQGYPTAQGYPGTQQGYPGTPQDHPGAQQGYPGTPQTYGGPQPGYGGYAAAPPVGAWRSPVDDRPIVPNLLVAARTVFSKYATFEGRASRGEFWWWLLLNVVVFAACYILALILIFSAARFGLGAALSLPGGLLIVAALLWELAVLVPGLAVLVRRLRDAGFHWGFIFLSLIPGGSIAVLVMCCMPSKYP